MWDRGYFVRGFLIPWAFLLVATCTSQQDGLLLDDVLMFEFRDSIANLQQWRTANNKVGWDSATPICQWTGVTCAADNQTILHLDIACLDDCTVPAQAPFPVRLSLLSALQSLKLDNNRMPGELPPPWADDDSFNNLTYLSLSNIGLYGTLPPEWGAAGAFPATRVVFLADNNLTGTLPTEWGGAAEDSWPQLQAMVLINNSLQGYVPSSWMSFGQLLTNVYLKPGNPQLCGNTPVTNSLIICSPSVPVNTTSTPTFNPLSDCSPLGFLGQACAAGTPDPQRLQPGDKVLPLFLDMLFNASVPFDFQQREHDSLVKALSIAMPGAATDGVLVLSPVINATDSLTLGSRRGRRLRGGVGGGGRRLQQVAGGITTPGTYQQLVATTITARGNTTAQQLQQQLESAVRNGEMRQLLQQEPGWEGLLAVDLATQQSFLGTILPGSPSTTTNTTNTNTSTTTTSSSTDVLAIALGVAIPCAVIAIVIILAAVYMIRRMQRKTKERPPLLPERAGTPNESSRSGEEDGRHLSGNGSGNSSAGFAHQNSGDGSGPLRNGSSALLRLESLAEAPSTLGISASLLQNLVSSAYVSDWEIDPQRLTLCERPDGSVWELGRGAYSRVYKALYDDVHTIALKVLQQAGETPSAAMFEKELAILRKCHNKNIVQFFGACLTSNQCVLAFEYMENGDLFKWLSSGAARFDFVSPTGKPMLAHKVALDVARGLHFLHSRNIVHNDLKSANILLSKDGTAKIGDVGLARVLRHGYVCSSSGGVVGTFAWAAPEVLLGRPVSPKADVYSYGVVLWELATNERPERGMLRPPRGHECPPEIAKLIDACLSEEPRNRPSMVDVIQILVNMQQTYDAQQAGGGKKLGKAQGDGHVGGDVHAGMDKVHHGNGVQVGHDKVVPVVVAKHKVGETTTESSAGEDEGGSIPGSPSSEAGGGVDAVVNGGSGNGGVDVGSGGTQGGQGR